MIDDEIESGISPSRIILGGFSQGGTMSLFTGLTIKYQLAGLVCLSGRLLLRERLKEVCQLLTAIDHSVLEDSSYGPADNQSLREGTTNFLGSRHCRFNG